MRRRWIVQLLLVAAAMLWAAAPAAAAQRCGRVSVPARGADAKVRVVHGHVRCKAARREIAAAFKAEVTRHWDGNDQVYGIYWNVDAWYCYVGLAETQTFCHRGLKEVDGSFRTDDGWTF